MDDEGTLRLASETPHPPDDGDWEVDDNFKSLKLGDNNYYEPPYVARTKPNPRSPRDVENNGYLLNTKDPQPYYLDLEKLKGQPRQNDVYALVPDLENKIKEMEAQQKFIDLLTTSDQVYDEIEYSNGLPSNTSEVNPLKMIRFEQHGRSFDIETLHQMMIDNADNVNWLTELDKKRLTLYYDALKYAEERNIDKVKPDTLSILSLLKKYFNRYPLSKGEDAWLRKNLRLDHLAGICRSCQLSAQDATDKEDEILKNHEDLSYMIRQSKKYEDKERVKYKTITVKNEKEVERDGKVSYRIKHIYSRGFIINFDSEDPLLHPQEFTDFISVLEHMQKYELLKIHQFLPQ